MYELMLLEWIESLYPIAKSIVNKIEKVLGQQKGTELCSYIAYWGFRKLKNWDISSKSIRHFFKSWVTKLIPETFINRV